MTAQRKLRYVVVADGVAVSFLRDGAHVASLTVTESEAKRFAWAILADLDPDGVCDVQIDASARPLSPGRKYSTSLGILRALQDAPAKAADICAATGIDTKYISARVIACIERGWAQRIDEGTTRGIRATYAITPAGRSALAERSQ
jgi:hypothetical protein